VTAPAPPPAFLVVEDGREYIDRFTRLLGASFRFARAGSAAEATAALAVGGVAGVLLDLDFRRTPGEALIDEAGRAGLPPHERRRVAAVQGILIARALRRCAPAIPMLLFADLGDAEQIAFLEGELAPLRVVASSVGLNEIGGLLARIATGGAP